MFKKRLLLNFISCSNNIFISRLKAAKTFLLIQNLSTAFNCMLLAFYFAKVRFEKNNISEFWFEKKIIYKHIFSISGWRRILANMVTNCHSDSNHNFGRCCTNWFNWLQNYSWKRLDCCCLQKRWWSLGQNQFCFYKYWLDGFFGWAFDSWFGIWFC